MVKPREAERPNPIELTGSPSAPHPPRLCVQKPLDGIRLPNQEPS